MSDNFSDQIFTVVFLYYWCRLWSNRSGRGWPNRLNADRLDNFYNWFGGFFGYGNEAGFTGSSFPISVSIGCVLYGDQRSKGVNVAVFSSNNIRVSGFGVLDVSLFFIGCYLVLICVSWVQLQYKNLPVFITFLMYLFIGN